MKTFHASPRFPYRGRTFLLPALIVLSLLTPAFAAEGAPAEPPPVSADNPSWDNVWKGEVVLNGSVRIPKGCSIKVLPGATVRFPPAATLEVEGKLVAEGADGNPVRFLPSVPGSRWGGIVFRESTEGSSLSLCVVEGAAASSMTGCSVPVKGCTFAGGGSGLFLLQGAAPVVEGNEFREMDDFGLRLERKSAPTVVGNRFVSCVNGIRAERETSPEVRGNVFLRCGEGFHLFGETPLPVRGNSFTANKVGLVAEGSGGSMRIEGNRFEGNEVGLVCFQSSSPLVTGNRIIGNGQGILCSFLSSPGIRRNDVSGNREGIYCTNLSEPAIDGNEFRGNDRSVVLTLTSYATLHGNNFEGGGVRVELETMSADWEARVRQKPVRGAVARAVKRESHGLVTPQDLASLSPGGETVVVTTGYVAAQRNWWGKEATAEMERLGKEGNIGAITDGYDMPVRRYEGDTEEYVQDRVDYSGWAREPFPGAGAGSAGPGEGAP